MARIDQKYTQQFSKTFSKLSTILPFPLTFKSLVAKIDVNNLV